MTDDEKLALIMVLANDGRASTNEIALGTGYAGDGWGRVSERAANNTRSILNRLKDQRALHHTYKYWQITEKGRIAAALLMFKDPGLAELYDDAKTT